MINIMRAIMRRNHLELGARPINNDDSRLKQATRRRMAVARLSLGPAYLDEIREHLACAPIQAWAALKDLETTGRVHIDQKGRYALTIDSATR